MIKKILIAIFLLTASDTVISAETPDLKGIAVVKSRYDNIELVLHNYNIPFTLINYSDLENEETLSSYSAIFFPSGLSSYYETNVAVNWRGKEITSAKISDDYFELDTEKFSASFRKYIDEGGAAYFSGYSYKLLSSAYEVFDFFYDFPYMGEPGRMEASVYNDLARFSLKKKAALYMDYTGWVAVKNADNAEILSESDFSTPRGEKKGPISMLFKYGKGEILYTSYYSTVYSEFKRFNIYRIAGNSVKRKLHQIIKNNFQKITGTIIDAFLGSETSRLYLINLQKGNNTLYFLSENQPYMFEIYDNKMGLIAAVDKQELYNTWNIISPDEDICFVKIYPSSSSRFGIFAIISAEGAIISKGVKITLAVIASLFILIFIAAFIKVLISRIK